MHQFIEGIIMMALAVSALCFLRFWWRSRDRLFLMFSVAFWILSINRLFLSMLAQGNRPPDEHQTLLYVIRLVAFTIILVAIIDKNRAVRRSSNQA